MKMNQKKTTQEPPRLFGSPEDSQHEGLVVKSQQVLNVTREFITQGNVRVGRHINGFIPESAVGSANKKNGKGTNI